MKEYRVITEGEYKFYKDLIELLNILATDEWEVKCTLGGYNHVLLLEREAIPPSPNATRASDD